MKKKAAGRKPSRDELLRVAMRAHAASGARWMEDFGDRPVVSYETGQELAPTAREYMRRRHSRKPRKT